MGSEMCIRDSPYIVTIEEGSREVLSIRRNYEIGDPQAYMLPDVICDFSNVKIEETEKDKVKISGAKGYPAPNQYKVCATYADGFRAGHVCSFVGIDAAKKARTYGEAIFERSKMIMRMMNIADFDETSIEIIGDKTELQQVFFNIIENAITHSQSKRPVQIKLMKKQKKVMFIVQDFGIGISNQNIPMLTKRFYLIL